MSEYLSTTLSQLQRTQMDWAYIFGTRRNLTFLKKKEKKELNNWKKNKMKKIKFERFTTKSLLARLMRSSVLDDLCVFSQTSLIVTDFSRSFSCNSFKRLILYISSCNKRIQKTVIPSFASPVVMLYFLFPYGVLILSSEGEPFVHELVPNRGLYPIERVGMNFQDNFRGPYIVAHQLVGIVKGVKVPLRAFHVPHKSNQGWISSIRKMMCGLAQGEN